MHSIRVRLLARLSLLFLLLWAAVTIATYLESRHEVEELFDAQLAQAAAVLAWFGTSEDQIALLENRLQKDIYGHPYEKKVAFQIWRNGTLVLRSANAPQIPMADADGYSSRHIDNGIPWRVFAMTTDAPHYRIFVGERDDIREELVNEITVSSLYPLSLVLPLIILAVWFGLGRGLAPLRRIAVEVEKRSSHNLEPVVTTDIPQEVLPLTNALNHLFMRVRDAFQRERRFTADAAHELRTPLASIKTQAQVAIQAADSAQRRHALEQIVVGVDRTTHLVEQLLTLARFDPDEAIASSEDIDLRTLVGETIATLDPQAMGKQLRIDLDEGPPAPVHGKPGALAILVRNLIDNALRYTPAGGEVHVVIEIGDHGTQLSITDTGPGIDEAERERIFERFYRGSATQHTAGSGLGLSIVQRIAELHGASVRFVTPTTGHGTRVEVVFPR